MNYFDRPLKLAGVALAMWLSMGCQTSPIVEFENVTLGQDKSAVLEVVGGPSWKDRIKGTDRWTYILYQDGMRLEREVHFLDGIVVFKGETPGPFITAEEQDDINDRQNQLFYQSERAKASFTPAVQGKATFEPDQGNAR
jgi:outer membrane protein assembly factor BamE